MTDVEDVAGRPRAACPHNTHASEAGSTQFYLPPLPRLLPIKYHPDAARIEIASNGWIRTFLQRTFGSESQLLHFLRQRNGIYGPLTVPGATYQRAQDIADWYQFVTVIDSAVSDRGALGSDSRRTEQLFARILADFDAQTPSEADFPYGRAVRDLWRRISPGLSREQRQRLTAGLEAFLRGCAVEVKAKLADDTPDYESCMRVRADSFGCEFIELMTEYGAEVDMSPLLADLAEVHHHCRRQMIIVNDLLSWRKEHAQDDKMTVVRVLIEREGLGLQEAVDRLCGLVEHHEKAYIAAREEVLGGPLGARDDVRVYLDSLDHMIGGSQEFEYLTPRYFGDGSVWDGSTSGWIDLNAAITRFTAAPTSSTAAPPQPVAPFPSSAQGEQAGRRDVEARHAATDSRAENRAWKTVAAGGALPLLGHALPLWRDPLRFLAALPPDAGLVELRLGPKRAYLAHHHELAQQVLADSRTFDKGGPLFEKARLLVGDGLVSSGWETHRRQRRLLQPAFHPARVPGYVAKMAQEIESELDSWQPGRPLDVSDVMHALTLKITARTMFATTAGTDAVREVAYCMPVIMRGVYKRMIAPIGIQEKLPTAHNRDFERVRRRMRELIRTTVAAYRRDGGADVGDLMSILVGTRDEETGEGLSDEEIHDQVMTLLIGGTETTGNTMGWALHLLATHPQVERRVHDEVDDVLDGRTPGFADLPRLAYTARVITETLRMYPPAWLLTRTTTRDVNLAGRSLHPGTIVLYSPYAMGRNPSVYGEPGRFDPDRWLPERAASLPRGANLPFGGGSRKCIGDSLGMAETTLTLAAVAARWRLRAIPGTKAGTAVPRASLGTGPLLMLPEPRVRGAGREPAPSSAGGAAPIAEAR